MAVNHKPTLNRYTGAPRKTKVFGVSLTERQHDRLAQKAATAGVSMAELVRRFIDDEGGGTD